MEKLTISGRWVGPGEAPFVIAEVGSNHNGDMDLCRRLIEAAAASGADAVKFQSWSEKTLIAEEEYQRNTQYSDKKRHFGSLREMVRTYQLTPERHREAARMCREHGVIFCSTPFSRQEVDLLMELDVPFFKIAAMDIIHLPLLRYVARTQRPVVISTGMATLGEIEQAIETVRAEGNRQIALLHCVSIYPPEYDTIQLQNITMLRQAFDVPVGFSDHTLGTAIPLAAIALGACIIEKHFTIDKDMAGWDHAISADPADLRAIVEDGDRVRIALGTMERRVGSAELAKRKVFRRSIVARRALPAGHVLTEDDLDAKRPGTGIPPNELRFVLGRRLVRDVRDDALISWADLV